MLAMEPIIEPRSSGGCAVGDEGLPGWFSHGAPCRASESLGDSSDGSCEGELPGLVGEGFA